MCNVRVNIMMSMTCTLTTLSFAWTSFYECSLDLRSFPILNLSPFQLLARSPLESRVKVRQKPIVLKYFVVAKVWIDLNNCHSNCFEKRQKITFCYLFCQPGNSGITKRSWRHLSFGNFWRDGRQFLSKWGAVRSSPAISI